MVHKIVAYGLIWESLLTMRSVYQKSHHVANFFVSDCTNFKLLSAVTRPVESTTQECTTHLFSCQCEEGKVLIVNSSFVSVKNSSSLPLS
jgi:hypothetical protein